MNNSSPVVLDLQLAVDADDLPTEDEFEQWLEKVILEHQDQAELTIRIVDESEISELNRQYRNKDYATNVLSFPVDSDLPLDIPLLGDLVICASVVAREAQEQRKSLKAHWAHMVIHGTLHLLGYDHIEDNQAAAMEAKEIEYLNYFGFSNPYEETKDS